MTLHDRMKQYGEMTDIQRSDAMPYIMDDLQKLYGVVKLSNDILCRVRDVLLMPNFLDVEIQAVLAAADEVLNA